jgi:hypothetical protein
VDYRLRLNLAELGNVMPAVAAFGHVVGGVLHPHDGHILGSGLVHQDGDVGDDTVTVVRAGHDAVLDVDDE